MTLGDTTETWKATGTTISSLHLAGRNTAARPDYIAPHPITLPSPATGQFTITLLPMSLTIVSAKIEQPTSGT